MLGGAIFAHEAKRVFRGRYTASSQTKTRHRDHTVQEPKVERAIDTTPTQPDAFCVARRDQKDKARYLWQESAQSGAFSFLGLVPAALIYIQKAS